MLITLILIGVQHKTQIKSHTGTVEKDGIFVAKAFISEWAHKK